MKYFILISFLLLKILNANTQEILPGGVSGVKIWEIAQPSEQADQTNATSLKLADYTKKVSYIKGNTIGTSKIYELDKYPTYSIFTVNQQSDTTEEQAILSIENDTCAESVITNKRLAALDAYRYANFNSGNYILPIIYSYSQNKSSDSNAVARRLMLGQTPRFQKLPIQTFKGNISELVLFNRCLSYREQLQVQTYLALKYAISLNQEYPVNYVNSKGQIIWAADINFKYNKNIAGIGKDALSGLCKKSSESIQTPGAMTIGLLNDIPDNTFLIWGDNGNDIRFNDESSLPRRTEREWKITAFHSSTKTVFAETNTLAFTEIDPFNKNEKLWLMIDRTGTGTYSFGTVDYILGEQVPDSKKIKFNGFKIDADSSGSDIFTFIAAPEFFARSIIIPPTKCIAGFTGSLQTEIIGGTPPFKIQLTEIKKTQTPQKFTFYNRLNTLENLDQGSYNLEITDAANKVYSENIWIANEPSWQSKIKGNYSVKEGESLTIDASEGMPSQNYIYSWETPNGENLNVPKINITEKGNYYLSIIDANGCNSIAEVQIKNTGKSNIKKTALFPNPSITGWFNVRISLFKPSDIQIIISDNTGKIIQQNNLYNNDYYWYSGFIKQKGIYYLIISTQGEKETIKLLIQ